MTIFFNYLQQATVLFLVLDGLLFAARYIGLTKARTEVRLKNEELRLISYHRTLLEETKVLSKMMKLDLEKRERYEYHLEQLRRIEGELEELGSRPKTGFLESNCSDFGAMLISALLVEVGVALFCYSDRLFYYTGIFLTFSGGSSAAWIFSSLSLFSEDREQFEDLVDERLSLEKKAATSDEDLDTKKQLMALADEAARIAMNFDADGYPVHIEYRRSQPEPPSSKLRGAD